MSLSSRIVLLVKRIASELRTRLSKAGGTVTGDIFRYVNGKTFSLGKLTNAGAEDSNIDIGWDYANGDGAGLGLRNTLATDSGGFSLYAKNGTSAKALNGSVDGSLKWADNDVLTSASTLDASKLSVSYLPLSGGTMTGDIKINGRSTAIIRQTDTAHNTIIASGTDWNDSPSVVLYGATFSNEALAGGINLVTGANGKILALRPDGTLTWGGTAVSLNGHTHNYLSSTGSTATTWAFAKGTNPSSNQYNEFIKYDNSGGGSGTNFRASLIGQRLTTAGETGAYMLVYDWGQADTANKVASLGIYYPKGGTPYTSAPTPATTDNSTKIATTAYVKSNYTPCTTKATTTNPASSAKPCVIVQAYKNGNDWYRVWSDGWIEQGGFIEASAGSTGVTVTFKKTMTTTNYYVSVIRVQDTTATSLTPPIVRTRATGSMVVNKVATSLPVVWYVSGY